MHGNKQAKNLDILYIAITITQIYRVSLVLPGPALPCYHNMLGSAKVALNRDIVKESFENAVDEFDARLDDCNKQETDGIDSDGSEWDTDLEDDDAEDIDNADTSGRLIYLGMCDSCNMLPSRKITEGLKSARIKLSNGVARPNEIKSLIAALFVNTHVNVLDLHSNNVDQNNVKDLRDLLLHNGYITEVNLADNRIGNAGANPIGSIIKDTKSLKKLDIGGNMLDDKASVELANGIALNESLKVLNLSHNQFMSCAGRDLGLAMETNQTM